MFEPPTQLVDYSCWMEAVDRDRNIARYYIIRATRDLFGHTIVELRWGRIGRQSSGLTISFNDEEAARRFVRRTLAKRANAPKRIGVSYQLVTGTAKRSPMKSARALLHADDRQGT